MKPQANLGNRRVCTTAARIGSCSAVAALALSLAACGGSAKSNKASPKGAASQPSLSPYTAPGKAKVPTGPVPKVTHVLVTDTDVKMTLSVSTFTPGNYNFTLKNDGQAKHALEINGPGLKNQTGATVLPGQSTDLIVPLVKGTYQVWGPVGADKEHGMTTQITVT